MAAPTGRRDFVKVLKILRAFRSANSYRSVATSAEGGQTTHFGFQTVSEDEKEEKVHEVFKNVADKYDLMNDAMSFGVHRLWKDYFIRRLAPRPRTKLLDVAGGTGDIAFRYLNYLKSLQETAKSATQSDYFDIKRPKEYDSSVYLNQSDSESESSSSSDSEGIPLLGKQSGSSHVTVCDINQSMLDVGKARAEDMGVCDGMSWLRGNAEDLPVMCNLYDAYTIAFGIRNCTHIDKVLQEAYRVLKPGGRFMCLEFTPAPNRLLKGVYDEYSFQVIPVMGQVLAGDWQSYQYLVESIRQFPSQEDFKAMIRSAGFRAVTYENLTFGVAAIHSGFKL